jgi:hypothetical protein
MKWTCGNVSDRRSWRAVIIWMAPFFTESLEGPKPMVDRELLSRKLSRLQGYVEVLKSAADITWQKY